MTDGSVLVLGARSDRQRHRISFASLGHPVQLAVRNAHSHQDVKADLEIRYGVDVSVHEFDALAVATHADLIESLPVLPDIVVCAVGLLGNQRECQENTDKMVTVFRTNFEGPAHLLSLLAAKFEARNAGILVGISSVAGERGRASNMYMEPQRQA